MKKKILLGLGALALAVVLIINVTFVTSSNNNTVLSLDLMKIVSQAQAESDEPGFNNVCKEDDCSVTISFVTYNGHYKHCGYGTGYCGSDCFVGCDAL